MARKKVVPADPAARLVQLGIGTEWQANDVLHYVIKTNPSPIIGAVAEMAYIRLMGQCGFQVEKVDNRAFRYDFICSRDVHRKTTEVKVARPQSVSIAFKDSRKVILPSGAEWKTCARHKSQNFDFLTISLWNITGRISDFAFMFLDFWPSYQPSDDELLLPSQDQEFMRENYYANSIRLHKQLSKTWTKDINKVLSGSAADFLPLDSQDVCEGVGIDPAELGEADSHLLYVAPRNLVD